jgi:hypothetical protein
LPKPRDRKPLPAILRRRRGRREDTVENAAAIWAALLARYNLTDLHAQLRSTPGEWPHGVGVSLAAVFWSALADALMADLVPAYGGLSKQRGRKKRFEYVLTGYYQAQYAAAVRKIAADREKSLAGVFEWLADKKTPQATADRKRLPSPYRGLRTKAAFKDAFYDIPLEVSRDPKPFPDPVSYLKALAAAMFPTADTESSPPEATEAAPTSDGEK